MVEDGSGVYDGEGGNGVMVLEGGGGAKGNGAVGSWSK
jgi:hypothetical protein